jgi:putative transposase
VRCWEGVVYLAFVLDVFSRRVVGWQLGSHMRTNLALDALRMARGHGSAAPSFGFSHPPTAAAHSASTGPRRSPRPRVGRVGRRRLRHAIAESFVDIFNTELPLADRVWRTRAQLERPSRSPSAGLTTTG